MVLQALRHSILSPVRVHTFPFTAAGFPKTGSITTFDFMLGLRRPNTQFQIQEIQAAYQRIWAGPEHCMEQ